MVKRLISADSSDMLAMNGAELKQSIKASEGRVVLSENVVLKNRAYGITTSEVACSFWSRPDLTQWFGTFSTQSF
jgi:hypothetical protein